MTDHPQLCADDALVIVGAFPRRPAAAVGPLGVEVGKPPSAVDSLGHPQHLGAVAEYPVVLPVRAGGHGAPVEVGREHGAESYGSGSQILRR